MCLAASWAYLVWRGVLHTECHLDHLLLLPPPSHPARQGALTLRSFLQATECPASHNNREGM